MTKSECLKKLYDRMSNDQNLQPEKKYDLGERTARFGEAIIQFARKIPVNPVTEALIGQLVPAGTSVGSNYCEADDAGSRTGLHLIVATIHRRKTRTLM